MELITYIVDMPYAKFYVYILIIGETREMYVESSVFFLNRKIAILQLMSMFFFLLRRIYRSQKYVNYHQNLTRVTINIYIQIIFFCFM